MKMKHGNNAGFTLIDVAVMLLVAGLVVGPLIHMYNVNKTRQAVTEAGNNVANVSKAIADFYFEKGYYPCPADLTKTITDADYGREVRVAGACAAAAPGVVEADGRDTNGDTFPEKLLIGGVPFATLKIPAAAAIDPWSSKLTYAVSKPLTAPPFDNANGVITVRALTFNPVTGLMEEGDVTPAGGMHYFFFSHGPDGIGSWTAAGRPAQPCPDPADPASPKEAENCDQDDTFLDRSFMSRANGALYNDDVVYYQPSVPTRIWVNSSFNGNDIVSNVDNIGIGTRSPVQDPDVKVDVRGNIKIAGAGAKAGTDRICDINGADCYPSQVIGGVGINCEDPADPATTGWAMTGIANADVKCANAITGGVVPAFTCPNADDAVIGTDAGGNLICGPLF